MRKTKIICTGLMVCMIVMLNVSMNTLASTKEGKEIFLDYVNTTETIKKNIPKEQEQKTNIEDQQKILKLMGWKNEDSDEGDLKDNYAGTYLDDKGNLVVMLDKDAKGNTKLETKIEDIDSNASVEKVKYNCKELADVKESYDEKIEELNKRKNTGELTQDEQFVLENVVGCGITIEDNCVTVYMKKNG